jgi:Tol biopolymer transport system component
MGEVYRARDTRLDRDVAIKVLPDAVASDPERIARFEREAKTLAALNHPNIAQIHGIEESGPVRALVMEFVEGDTLADRIAVGRIPLHDALSIAKQIADALEAAHEHGIVHRDLKPANIKVRDDGTVKVLDFGLAKAMEPIASLGGGATGLTNSPTITSPALMTGVGVLVGTAAYMSPEQAKGRLADKRSDIWAFGCVLYEMLAGTRAFQGDDVSETLAAVLRGEPDWAALPRQLSASTRLLLQRCLIKDRQQRVADLSTVRFVLTEPAPDGSAAVHASRPRERIAWVTVVAVLTLMLAGVVVWAFRPVAPPPETRLEIATPDTTDPLSFAISPDGRQLVFVALGDDGKSRLWLRPLDATAAQSLPGTEDAQVPFWSPDSRSVGFATNRTLKRLDLGFGTPRPIATLNTLILGATWSPDNVILIGQGPGRLLAVPAAGGEARTVATLADGQISQRYPSFLPGGRQFVFYASGSPTSSGIYLGSLDAPGTTRLTEADAAAEYSSGWLFFGRQGSLVAQRLDVPHGVLVGDPVHVADAIDVDPISRAALSVSTSGFVAYRSSRSKTQLTWFDHAGQKLGTIGERDDQGLSHPRLSPGGDTVVVHRTKDSNTDLWLVDTAHTTRMTFDRALDEFPLWRPDGQQIVFAKQRTGVLDLYVKPPDPAGSEDLLLESSENKSPQSWSPDGRFLLYSTRSSKTGSGDLWVLPLQGERKPYPFVNTQYEERVGVFSPDGHWVAYQSDESGRPEIYVRPFPGPGPEKQVSAAGGITPRWSPHSNEVYFIAPDSKLMASSITVHGATVEPGVPIVLFQTRIEGGGTTLLGVQSQFDVARDGRFLINTLTDSSSSLITIIQNWAPPIRK